MAKQAIETINLESFRDAFKKAFEEIEKSSIIFRIWKKDYTVWKPKDKEISNRLGWLDSPESTTRVIPELKEFLREIQEDGYTQALLLGMGGSSLAPQVFSQLFPTAKSHLDLKVLSTTEPGAVLKFRNSLNPQKTLFIVSSKSGTTLETVSLFNFFFTWMENILGQYQAGKHFVAITDPNTPLEKTARDLNFRKIFYGVPSIGGRFSALSTFGLVPAALKGVNLPKLFEGIKKMARLCQESTPEDNPAAYLGGVLATLAQAGLDKIVFIVSAALESFASWLEQLLAESTGKEGKGILPIVEGPLLSTETLTDDRIFVYFQTRKSKNLEAIINRLKETKKPLLRLSFQDIYDAGSQFFLWEMATAITGFLLKINPFDQPDVEVTKKKTQDVLKILREKGCLFQEKPSFEADGFLLFSEKKEASLEKTLRAFFSQARPGDYLAIQAFLEPTPEVTRALQKLKMNLEKHIKLAVTFNYGPSFLHSTGQLHKGDKGNGLFIQLTSEQGQDLPIPDQPGSSLSSLSFATLLSAQARGDWEALKERGRRIIRFHLGQNAIEGLATLCSLI